MTNQKRKCYLVWFKQGDDDDPKTIRLRKRDYKLKNKSEMVVYFFHTDILYINCYTTRERTNYQFPIKMKGFGKFRDNIIN